MLAWKFTKLRWSFLIVFLTCVARWCILSILSIGFCVSCLSWMKISLLLHVNYSLRLHIIRFSVVCILFWIYLCWSKVLGNRGAVLHYRLSELLLSEFNGKWLIYFKKSQFLMLLSKNSRVLMFSSWILLCHRIEENMRCKFLYVFAYNGLVKDRWTVGIRSVEVHVVPSFPLLIGILFRFCPIRSKSNSLRASNYPLKFRSAITIWHMHWAECVRCTFGGSTVSP